MGWPRRRRPHLRSRPRSVGRSRLTRVGRRSPRRASVPHSIEAVQRLPLGQPVGRHVLHAVVDGVTQPSASSWLRSGLVRRRPTPAPAPRRRRVDRLDIVAIHDDARHRVAVRATGDVGDLHVLGHRRGVGVLVVLDKADPRRIVDRGQVEGFVEQPPLLPPSPVNDSAARGSSGSGSSSPRQADRQ